MKVRKRQKVLSIFCVVGFVLSIAMFVWYEFGGGKNTLNYGEILVLKEPVKQGTTINKSMLIETKYDKSLINQDYVQTPIQIEGLEAKHYIPANTPLVTNYFDDADVVLNEGQYVAQIPKSWITSVPQSLRRGDNVILYATQIQADSSKQITVNSEGEMVVEDTLPTAPMVTTDLVELSQTTIAFVKDSANTEVVTTSNEDRKDANSNIASVEIVTTPAEFKEIERQVNNGSYLIIMYTDTEVAAANDSEENPTTEESQEPNLQESEFNQEEGA